MKSEKVITELHLRDYVKENGIFELLELLDMSDTLIMSAILNSHMRDAVISRYYDKKQVEIDQIVHDKYHSKEAKAAEKADLNRVRD
jgi:hypothetical protein